MAAQVELNVNVNESAAIASLNNIQGKANALTKEPYSIKVALDFDENKLKSIGDAAKSISETKEVSFKLSQTSAIALNTYVNALNKADELIGKLNGKATINLAISAEGAQSVEASLSSINELISSINSNPIDVKVNIKEVTALEKAINNVSKKKINISSDFVTFKNDIEQAVAGIKEIEAVSSANIPCTALVAISESAQQAKASMQDVIDAYQHLYSQMLSRYGLNWQQDRAQMLGGGYTGFTQGDVTSTRFLLGDVTSSNALVVASQRAVQAVSNVGNYLTTGNNGYQNFGRQIIDITDAVNGVGDAAEKAEVKLSPLTKSILNGALVLAVSKLRNAFREAFDEMKAVDSELVTIQKTTGASSAQMDVYEKTAYSTAAELGTTASEYLNAVAQFAKAGYGDLSEQMGELAIKTASVGDMSQETATSMLLAVNAAYKYGGSIKDLTRVVDGMNEIGNNFATDMDKISAGLGKVSSIAAQTGVGIDELSAALGTITAVTQRSGQEAATALRALFLNIIGDTKTEIEDGATWTAGEIEGLRDVMKMYIPEIVEEADKLGTVINPMEAIGALAEAYGKGMLTEAKLMEMVTDIGGKLRSSQLLTLIQNWGMYEDMLGTYADGLGSAAEEYSIYLDSWEAKTKQLNATWTEFISKTISSDFAKGFIDGLKEVLVLVGDLGSALVTIGGLLVAFKLESIITGVSSIGKVIATAVSSITPLGAAIAGLTVAYTVVNAIQNKRSQLIDEEAKKSKELAEQEITSAKSLSALYAQYKSAEVGSQAFKEASTRLSEALGVEGASVEELANKYKELTEAQANNSITAANTARVAASADLVDRYKRDGSVFSTNAITRTETINAIESSFARQGIGLSSNGFTYGYAPNSNSAADIYSYYIAVGDAIERIQKEAKKTGDDSLLSSKEYLKLSDIYSSLTSEANAYADALKNVDIAQAVVDFQNDMSIGTIESQATFDGYLAYINTFTEKSETWKEMMVSLAREAFPQFSTDVAEISEEAESATKSIVDLIDEINDGAKPKKDDGSKTISDAVKDIIEAKDSAEEGLREDDFDAVEKAYETAKKELRFIKSKIDEAQEYADEIKKTGEQALAQSGGEITQEIQLIMDDYYKARAIVDGLEALYEEERAIVGGIGETYSDSIEVSKLVDYTEEAKGVAEEASSKAKEAAETAKKAREDATAAINDAMSAANSGSVSEAQDAVSQAYNYVIESQKQLKEADKQVSVAKAAVETATRQASASKSSEAWLNVLEAQKSLQEAEAIRDEAYRLAESAQTEENLVSAKRLIALAAENSAHLYSVEERTADAKKYAKEAEEAEKKADDAAKNAEKARDSAVEAKQKAREETDYKKEKEYIEEANKAASEAQEALHTAKEASDTANKDVESARESVRIASESAEAIADGTEAKEKANEKYIESLEHLAEAEKDAKKVEEELKTATEASAEATRAAVEASTNAAAKDLLGLISELEAAKKAIENFGNAGKDEHGGVFGDFADMFSTALDLSGKGLFGSKELGAALSAIFGDSLMQSIGFDTKTASGWLQNNEFIKAAFANGGQDYGAGAAAYLKNLIDANDAMKQFVDYSENADGSLNMNIKDAEGLAKQLGVSQDLIWAMVDAWSIFDSDLNYSTEGVQKLVDEFSKIDGIIGSDGRVNAGKMAQYLFGQGFTVKDIYDIQNALADMGYTLFHFGDNGEEQEGGLEDIKGFLDTLSSEEGTEIKITVTDGGTTEAVQGAIEGVQEAVDGLSGSEADVTVSDGGSAASVRSAVASVGSAISAVDGRSATVTVNIEQNGSIPEVPAHATGVKEADAGLALVNDEAGGYNPELIVDGDRAYIAGGGYPTVVHLNKGATVFTATETRKILGGKSLDGVTIPAFKNGAKVSGVNPNYTGGDASTKSGGGGGSKKGSGSGSGSGSKDEDLLDMVQRYMEDILEEAREARDEQLNLIEKQLYYLKFGQDISEKATELEEARMKLLEAEQNLVDAQTERTVRYYNQESGQWEWMADQRAINEAQQSLADAQKDLVNARYDALEEVWKKLEEEIKNALDEKDEVSLKELLKLLKKSEAADTVDSLLELLDDINKFVGNPSEGINLNLLKSFDNGGIAVGKGFMPKATRSDEVVLDGSLASNIISPSVSGNFVAFTDALSNMFGMANEKAQSIYSGNGITNNNGGNTYINGVQIGSDMMNQPLSEILSVLPIYAGR